jgi:DnaK suppressor protein
MSMRRNEEEIRGQLEAERKELIVRIDQEREKASISDDLDNPDITEMASDYDLQQRTSAMAEIFQLRLVEIDQALQRLEEGTYGRCSSCGEEISAERLRMDPLAKFCDRCNEYPLGHDAPIRPTEHPE